MIDFRAIEGKLICKSCGMDIWYFNYKTLSLYKNKHGGLCTTCYNLGYEYYSCLDGVFLYSNLERA